LAGLPDTFTSTTDLNLWDDGTPNTLTMTWDGVTATASGKYPANFTPIAPEAALLEDEGTFSFIESGANGFAANANAGVMALGLMTSGTLVVTETSITLTGEAPSPRVSAALDDTLAGAVEGTAISRDVTYLDDGSPAAWTLTYDAASGAIIDGRLPNGLEASTVAQTLGVNLLAGTPATAFEDDDIGSSLQSLEILSGYLAEVETISYSKDSNGSALDLVLSPGVNVDLVATQLAERLPGDVSFSLSVLDPFPEIGATRTNALSSLEEVFTDGYWLPSPSFAADVAECDAQTLNVFERGKIGFLSSSALFDATSTGVVNGLAGVALACADAGLTLEVGGHTDATGSALANEVLSANRANSVRTALIERGVPEEAITAFGYGQTEPIADNETAEGRAANRRTDITWFAADAADNP
jgi:OOP family OmpA-OmpF porin